MKNKETLEKIINIRERINTISEGYYHSNPLSSIVTPFGTKVNLDIFDWGLIGALTESPMLLTGDTDRGKTDYMKILLTSLFGKDGFHKVDVDIDFGSSMYTTHNFNELTNGGTSDNFFEKKSWLGLPAIFWDETNRAPAKLLNKLLHITEKELTLENGKKIQTGLKYENGFYQFNVFAINEGEDYHGTNDIDRALRRRQTIEIPMDVFQTTMQDKKHIIEKRKGRMDLHNGGNYIDDVIRCMESIKLLDISPVAEHLLLYLQSMDYCDKSRTKSKKGINFTQNLCQSGIASCHYINSYANQMCPNVYGISEGLSINMVSIAKAHAYLRAKKVVEAASYHLNNNSAKGFMAAKKSMQRKSFFTNIAEKILGYKDDHGKSDEYIIREVVGKYLDDLKVEPEDIVGIFPFVAYSKTKINRSWLEKNYQGSRWLALNEIAQNAFNNVQNYHSLDSSPFSIIINGSELKDQAKDDHENAIKSDVWLASSLESYTANKEMIHSPTEKILDLL